MQYLPHTYMPPIHNLTKFDQISCQQEMIMKSATLALLCCSALLTACDDAKDAAKQATGEATNGFDSALESVKESASGAMDAASDKVSDKAGDAMVAGKNLKDTATESAGAAVDSVKESIGGAVDAAKDMSSAAVEKSSAAIASISADDVKQGQDIYRKTCVACHGSGAAGSPKLGDKAAWEARIAQGNAVMTQHAIEGFKGDTGYMPPKGGAMTLSDEDVSKAVKYMASQVQ